MSCACRHIGRMHSFFQHAARCRKETSDRTLMRLKTQRIPTFVWLSVSLLNLRRPIYAGCMRRLRRSKGIRSQRCTMELLPNSPLRQAFVCAYSLPPGCSISSTSWVATRDKAWPHPRILTCVSASCPPAHARSQSRPTSMASSSSQPLGFARSSVMAPLSIASRMAPDAASPLIRTRPALFSRGESAPKNEPRATY